MDVTDYLFSECSKTEEVSWRKDWVEKWIPSSPASPYLTDAWFQVPFSFVSKIEHNSVKMSSLFTPICTAIKRLKQDNIKTYGKRKKKAWKMLALCQ